MRASRWLIFCAFFSCLVFSAYPCGAQTAPQIPASVPPQSQNQNGQPLTLQDAEKIAIQNHPQIQAATDMAAVAKAEVTQARSTYYPTAYGSVTAVDAENNSRIAAGALNNPIIYERYANGLTVNQLVTDFGRTHELVKSSNLHAQAAQENVVTTRADVLLGVDQAYYGVLRAQAVLTVAQETVKDRQLVADQVTELQKNQIKSGLDVSFANVNLAQAQLLLVQAQNDLDASQARLSAALGYGDQRTFQLQEQPVPPAPPTDFAALLQDAFMNRPELVSLRLDANSAHAYATAERDLKTVASAHNEDLAALAKLALAAVYRDTNRTKDAIELYNQLMAKPTRSVGKATAQMELAETYESTQQPAEAKRVYEQIQKENPATEVAQFAAQKLQDLK